MVLIRDLESYKTLYELNNTNEIKVLFRGWNGPGFTSVFRWKWIRFLYVLNGWVIIKKTGSKSGWMAVCQRADF